MVKALVDLTERAPPKALDYFVAVAYMIPIFANIFSVLRIEAVVLDSLRGGTHQLWVSRIDIVNLFIVEDLCFFIVKQIL